MARSRMWPRCRRDRRAREPHRRQSRYKQRHDPVRLRRLSGSERDGVRSQRQPVCLGLLSGAIYRIDNAQGCIAPCGVTTVLHHPLLATAGFPPFGANGLALSKDELTLFVANTGDDRVLKVDLAAGPVSVSVFTESINGADGIAFDDSGILWVAANQADEIVGLNAAGRVVAKIGAFDKSAPTSTGRIAVSRQPRAGWPRGYITNLALPLTPAVGDEPEEDVTRWTVSRFRLLPNRRQ